MKQKLIKMVLVLVGVSFLCMAGQAMAENKYMPKVSKWGPDDQIGNAQLPDPQKGYGGGQAGERGQGF